MRFFNTEGPINPQDHYFIPPLDRVDIDEVLTLIRRNPSSPPSLVSSRIPGFFGLNRKNPRRCPARKSFAISEFTFTYVLFVQL